MGEFGTVYDLAFKLSSSEVHISWTRKVEGVEEGYFHLASLSYGLRFPLSGFILKLLNEYGIIPSQLASNLCWILTTFYLGCKAMLVQSHSKLFRIFYSLCRKGQYYHFLPKDSPIVIDLSCVQN